MTSQFSVDPHPPSGGLEAVAPGSVLIAALTCGRPRGLGALLDGVAGLRLPEGRRVGMLVVDNNADGSARRTVEAAARRMPFDLHYRHEPRRGISFARNTALAFARGRAEFLAFIDDDEVPSPNWLSELLRVQALAGAAAVTGPVQPRFVGPVPAWAADGAFHASRGGGLNDGSEPADGEPARVASSANLLIRTALLSGAGGFRFDEALALTGGEDTLLFAQLRAAGHRVVYARGALAYETVPPSRARLSWLLRRWYRTGNTDALVLMRQGGGGRLGVLARGLIRVVAGTALAAGTAVLAPHRPRLAIGRLYTAARGAGMIAYGLDRKVEEYRTIHGA